MADYNLVPVPVHLEEGDGVLPLAGVTVGGPLAELLASELATLIGRDVPVVQEPVVSLAVEDGGEAGSYELAITPGGATVTGADRAGLRYGIFTLAQLARRAGEGWELPAVFYRRLPDRTSYNIDGSVDHRWAAFVFSCVASQFEKLQALLAAEAITRDLLGYTAVTDTEIVHRVFVENAGDQYDGEARRHLVTVKVEALCTARA